MRAKFVYQPPANGYPEWNNNPEIFELNRLDAHASMIPYSNLTQALVGDKEASPYYKTLNGIWKFSFLKHRIYESWISIKLISIAAIGLRFLYLLTGSSMAMITRNIRMCAILGRNPNLISSHLLLRQNIIPWARTSEPLLYQNLGTVSLYTLAFRG